MGKRRLRVVPEGSDGLAELAAGEAPFPLFERAMAGATNDEAIELCYLLFEELARRAENAVDIARQVDDRDVANETFVFVERVDDLIPYLGASGRVRHAAGRVLDLKPEVERLVSNARSDTPQRTRTVVEKDWCGPDEIPAGEVMLALERAIEAKGSDAVSTADIGRALWPDVLMHANGRASRAQLRLAQLLAKLVRHGDVVRVRGDGRSHRWTLAEGVAL